MTTTLCVRRSIYFFAYAGLFWWFVAVPSVAAADTALAGAYLQDHLNSPWVTMALVALGENPDTTYLQSAEGSTAIDLEAPILALTAAGKNPYTYPETDLIAALKAFYFEGQLGEKDMLNDDIFGILALVSAGVPGADPGGHRYGLFFSEHQPLRASSVTAGGKQYGAHRLFSVSAGKRRRFFHS